MGTGAKGRLADQGPAPDPVPDADGIEYGIPIPRVRSEYAWESFRHMGTKIVPKGASSSARKFVKDSRPGWKVVERSIAGDEKNIRIWFTDTAETAREQEMGQTGGEDENPVEEAPADG